MSVDLSSIAIEKKPFDTEMVDVMEGGGRWEVKVHDHGLVALLDVMLARGADVNARVTGAASYSGRLARALTGDPVNTTSNEGMTALHVAVRSRNPSLVRYLLDKGARTDIKDASGRTPLDVLNGVPAYQPAVFADADGVVPPNPNAARPAPAAAAGNVAAVEEIRGLLQAVR